MTDTTAPTGAIEAKQLVDRLVAQLCYAYAHGGGHSGHLNNAFATQKKLHAAIDALAAAAIGRSL